MNAAHFPSRLFAFTAMILALTAPVRAADPQHSQLWGAAGEKWTPSSRLPDFSFAGYAFGEKPIPDLPPKADVTTFGAKGDGTTDDTQAFLNAIQATSQGAIVIPPGRYLITQPLEITRSNVVLRGAGPDKTILYFPKCLNDIKPSWMKNSGGRKCTHYSFSGGFISIHGSIADDELAVIGPARRGDTTVTVTPAKPLQVGQRVQVVLTDPDDRSLTHYLYSGDSGNSASIRRNQKRTLSCVNTAVAGDRLTLSRPLRWDLREEWKPRLCDEKPSTSNSGIENLAVEFPKAPYNGEFSELGYNAFDLSGVTDCWIRNIRVKNADSVLFCSAKQCTIRDFVVESQRNEPGHSCGHHAFCFSHGEDNLLANFQLTAVYMHEITVALCSSGNVFVDGKGLNMAFDHHGGAPYENLFSNIDVGKGTRIWHCGGGKGVGKSCGARQTFWNIRSERPSGYPNNFGPQTVNFVGVKTTSPGKTKPEGIWFEAIDPEKLQPQNLYQAQLDHRLGK